MVNLITFTTYDNIGGNSGTPFVFGFTDKSQNNDFDNTGTSTEADFEIPPPPPPGDGAGNPISTSYIDSMYVKVNDGTNDINAYQYLLDISDNSDISLNLAVRDYNANNVVFKYNHSDISGVLGTLNITNDSWTIDLVDASVTGSGVSIDTTDVNERIVTLPHLADNNSFYTMNLKQYVADSGPTEVTQTISFGTGYTWFSLYVNTISNTVGSVFTNPIVNTQILSQTSNTKYTSGYFGSSWNNTSFTFDNKNMYIAFIPSPSTYDLVVTGNTDSEVSINLVAGWNWISYPSTIQKTVGTLISNQEANDQILSQTSNTKYTSGYFGSSWNNSSFTFDPHTGYKYYSVSPKTLLISIS